MTYVTEAAPTVTAMLTTRLDTADLEAELVDQMAIIAGIDADAAELDAEISRLRDQRNALAIRRSRHDALCYGLRTAIATITGRALAPELTEVLPTVTDDYDEVPF